MIADQEAQRLQRRPNFRRGDIVEKWQGARFWGVIVNEPWCPPLGPNEFVWHYDVMATHHEFVGTVHIMVEHQIRIKL